MFQTPLGTSLLKGLLLLCQEPSSHPGPGITTFITSGGCSDPGGAGAQAASRRGLTPQFLVHNWTPTSTESLFLFVTGKKLSGQMFLFLRHLQVSLHAFPNLTREPCAGASKEGLSCHPRPAGQEGRRASVVPSPQPHAWIQDVPPSWEPRASSASGQGRVRAHFGGLLGCTDTLAVCQDCLRSRTHEQRGGTGSAGPPRERH